MMRAPAQTQATSTRRAGEIAGHFSYYAQLAHGMGLGFVTETAAYDLAALCERAFDARRRLPRPPARGLPGDRQGAGDDRRGERAARRAQGAGQARDATTSCAARRRARARIFEDMAHESPERLRSIRDELLAIDGKDFWEVVDRGTNFDYLDDARKAKLREFFGWFTRLESSAPPTAVA